jgi:hypothetical protein
VLLPVRPVTDLVENRPVLDPSRSVDGDG